MNLKVLESITDVDGTEFVRVELVEEVISGPGERSNHHGLLSLVFLQRPRATRLVLSSGLKELLIEGNRGQVQVGTFLLILHIPEVQVVLKTAAHAVVEAAEGFIPTHLVLWGHLE